MKSFKFEIGERVSLSLSGESGTVRARAEWNSGQKQYFVTYLAADGRQVDAWVDEDLLI